MKKCEEFAPLLSAFVDGELTEEERAEVLAHVSECEKCRRLLSELTALHAALGELEDEDVPAGFTEGVMAAVCAEKAAKKPQTKKRSAWRRWMPMAACAAIVALAAAVTIPRTAMKQEANDTAPAAPAAQEDQVMFSMAAPPSDPLPDTDAEVEYPEQRCETVQSSPYYDRQLGGAAADGFKTANAPADLENGSPEAEYYCETAPIGESGREGKFLAADYGLPMFELYGAGRDGLCDGKRRREGRRRGRLLCSHRRAARAAGGAFHDGRAGGSAHARSCRRGVGNRLPR